MKVAVNHWGANKQKVSCLNSRNVVTSHIVLGKDSQHYIREAQRIPTGTDNHILRCAMSIVKIQARSQQEIPS
jgi:hypothetical protein